MVDFEIVSWPQHTLVIYLYFIVEWQQTLIRSKSCVQFDIGGEEEFASKNHGMSPQRFARQWALRQMDYKPTKKQVIMSNVDGVGLVYTENWEFPDTAETLEKDDNCPVEPLDPDIDKVVDEMLMVWRDWARLWRDQIASLGEPGV